MTYATLLLDTDADGIAVVTINRPDKLNALNAQVFSDLSDLLDRIKGDQTIRAVIVTGAGPKAFVAGADIGELAAVDGAEGARLSARGQAVFRDLERLSIPVIAAVNGFALGGGCELAMACHLRLAAPAAKFGQPEVKLGLIPGYGGTVRLPRLVGRGRALELLLTARVIDAEEALRIGLVERIVAADVLLDEARAMARTILAMGPRAVALCLSTVDAALDLDLDAALAVEAGAFGVACASDDKREGTAAFLEKRPAAFTGR
ncbi:MAG: enoyl-CoA hydratase-related protein [Gemmatimonadales bacterium]|nr:enoyl-CoA hydratase-related protein [Gemmatimonadales bacterium]MDZ4389561.1 enoyl-CoA hydratase-related protein [Gemmatimonadales bacterium]